MATDIYMWLELKNILCSSFCPMQDEGSKGILLKMNGGEQIAQNESLLPLKVILPLKS